MIIDYRFTFHYGASAFLPTSSTNTNLPLWSANTTQGLFYLSLYKNPHQCYIYIIQLINRVKHYITNWILTNDLLLN
jgi:hypothetical protein